MRREIFCQQRPLAVPRVRSVIHLVQRVSYSCSLVELTRRTVRIYQPTRNTMQSGSGKTERWRIDFDILPGGSRWENPLMGYASSADYMQGTRLSFRSKEDAAHFAAKQGTPISLF